MDNILHCWVGRRDELEYGSDKWVASYADDWQDGTCMLERGHVGPHQFTPDSDITVSFGGETDAQKG